MGQNIKNQIVEYLVGKFQNGDYDQDAKLPSEHFLANKFNCSRNTVQLALQALKSSSIIKPIQGQGSFINLCHYHRFISAREKHRAPHVKFEEIGDNDWEFLKNHWIYYRNDKCIKKTYSDEKGIKIIVFSSLLVNDRLIKAKTYPKIPLGKFLYNENIIIFEIFKTQRIIAKDKSKFWPKEFEDYNFLVFKSSFMYDKNHDIIEDSCSIMILEDFREYQYIKIF